MRYTITWIIYIDGFTVCASTAWKYISYVNAMANEMSW